MQGVRMRLFGNMCKMYREELNLSQDDLGRRVGYPDGSMISAIESGKKSPPLERALKIAHALGHSIAEMLGEGAPGRGPRQFASGDHNILHYNEGQLITVQDDQLTDLIKEGLQEVLDEGFDARLNAIEERLAGVMQAAMDGWFTRLEAHQTLARRRTPIPGEEGIAGDSA